MNGEFSLKGKSGIITGAASGIGKATAIKLAELGAGLTLVDIDKIGIEQVREEIGKFRDQDTVFTIITDVSRESDVCTAVDSALSHFNSIDFLVNCAGIIRRTSFLEIGTEEWDLVFGINIRGQFLFCRTVLAHMKERNRGVIVNVASLAGRTCSLLGGAHYTSAKHALIGLSRHLALEYAPLGIRVNAFCPGATVTPLVFNSTSKEEISRLEASIPRRKCASAQEQANIIAFLISDASANIVGACIDSNGGSLMI